MATLVSNPGAPALDEDVLGGVRSQLDGSKPCWLAPAIAAGALEEVRALAARGLDPLHPAMKAHGVPWLREVLSGGLGLAAAAVEAKQDTRRYAKRQFTWFRHQLPNFPWIPDHQARDCILRALEAVRA